MGWQVIIAPSAQTDLADIVRYIAQHNSDAAARLGFELITSAENLADFPEIGRRVPEFRQPNLREIICRSYRIIYRLRVIINESKLSASGTGHADFLTSQAQLDLPELTGPFRRSLDCFQLLPARVEFREIFLRGGKVGGVS